MSEGKILIVYVDGSTRPTNPGFSGYGMYGYTLSPSKRPTKVKHPVKPKLYFTSIGVSEEPDADPYETIDIVEHIGSIPSNTGTNNLAELVGFYKTLQIALNLNVKSVRVITDSSYVVNNFTDHLKRWKSSGWLRNDGKPIAHKVEWDLIDRLADELISKGCEIIPVWVKGHDNDYGNETADLYASIGSNYSRIQDGSLDFNEVAYDSVVPYKDYKDSLLDKDIIYHFRDLFFSSSELVDTNYCFLSTSQDPTNQGRRDTTSIFVTNLGYIPEVINDIKSIFRKIPRHYITNCCIKLNRLEDKELSRLSKLVGIEKMVKIVEHHTGTQLYLIKDTSPFVTEYSHDYPYIIEASSIFNNTLDILTSETTEVGIIKKDVTDIFVKDGKIAFSNNDKNVDLTEVFNDHYKIINNLYATVGSDIPNYIALKSLESDIKKVTAITELKSGSNYLSLYIAIETSDRVLCSINIVNKFLINR